MRKAFFKIILCGLFGFLLAGCGHVKSTKQLIRQAKREHGKCEVVSQTENEKLSEVVLRDKLQGFEYKIYSSMYDINIDGASFGSLPSTTDTFEGSLKDYVLEQTRPSLEAICEKYKATYDNFSGDVLLNLRMNPSATDHDAVQIAEEVAELMQEYNMKNRMDGMLVFVSHDDEWLQNLYKQILEENGGEREGYIFSSAGGAKACHIGSVKLPDCKFMDREKEQEEYFLGIAQMKDKEAVFLYSEKKTFADTGLALSRVSQTLYQEYPQSMSDPVYFYYYRAGDKEFFICDFLDDETGAWYTNYE